MITAGLGDAEVSPTQVTLGADGRPVVRVDGRTFHLAARGQHQAGNAMFAWAIARELGLDLDAVAKALEAFTIPGGRGELKQHGALTVLNDGYNANPQSFAERHRPRAGAAARDDGSSSWRARCGNWASTPTALHAEVAGALAATASPSCWPWSGSSCLPLPPTGQRFAGRLLEAPDAEAMGPLLAARLAGRRTGRAEGFSRGRPLSVSFRPSCHAPPPPPEGRCSTTCSPASRGCCSTSSPTSPSAPRPGDGHGARHRLRARPGDHREAARAEGGAGDPGRGAGQPPGQAWHADHGRDHHHPGDGDSDAALRPARPTASWW